MSESAPPWSRVLPSSLRRARLYRQHHGRLPPWGEARTFTEKLQRRITRDRRPLLAPTCDKLAMKEHFARRAPDLLRVPRTYWTGSDVAELADVDLPGAWVLKPNHSCRRVLVAEGPPDVADLAARTAGWVAERYWRDSEEWAYRCARPGLLVEEHIGEPGEVPTDLKVLVFHGVPRVVGVHTGRRDVHRARLYTAGWEPLPWTWGYPPGPDLPRPAWLPELLAAAAAAAAGFDMLRVDLYRYDGRLWAGELTPYPGAGLSRLEPGLDAWLGSWWTLPAEVDRPRWRTAARRAWRSSPPGVSPAERN
ncbi:ATP-grasp fold amidoligase family protein [Geodermatophilus sp. SYSU D00684]